MFAENLVGILAADVSETLFYQHRQADGQAGVNGQRINC